jgi:hypothetical protein
MAADPVNLPEGYNVVDHTNVPEGYTLIQPPGMVESAARGALNNFPMAKQAASAVLPGNYSKNLADLSQKASIAKVVNPISYGAGSVAGAVAPMAIPGVGEALEAAPVAGNAAYGALQGLSDTDLLKQPGEALKQAAVGAGIGGTVGKFLPQGKSAQEGLESFANKKGVQALGLQSGELGVSGKEIQNMGNLANETGLFEGSTEDRFNTAKDLVQQTGKQIEDLGEGKVLQNTQPYIQNLHNTLQESASVFGKGDNPESALYRQAMANLQRPGGVTFEQLQSFKNAAADRAFDKVGNIKNDAAFNVFKEYSDAMESLASDHPEYKDLKSAYGNLRSMQNGLERQLQTEQAKGAQAKGIGMMGRIGGAITGGNVPATLGAAAILGPAHPLWAASLATTIATNPEAMQGAARTAAQYAPGAVQGSKQALIDYLTSKYGGSNAQR